MDFAGPGRPGAPVQTAGPFVRRERKPRLRSSHASPRACAAGRPGPGIFGTCQHFQRFFSTFQNLLLDVLEQTCLTCRSKDLLGALEQKTCLTRWSKDLLDMLEQRLAGRARWSICGCGQATADGAFPSKLATAAFAARWISLAS